MASKYVCPTCERWIAGPAAVKGRDGRLYCSAACCTAGDLSVRVQPSRRVKVKAQWWVCRMKDGGYFIVESPTRPDGTIVGSGIRIAAGSYDVVYGPCGEAEGEAYMDDMAGE